MTEGIIIYRVVPTSTCSLLEAVQKAIEIGGQAYRKRYGRPPAYVALPSSIDPTGLQLWTLAVAEHRASGGTVQILGEA